MQQRRNYVYQRMMNIISSLPTKVNPSIRSQLLFETGHPQDVQIDAK